MPSVFFSLTVCIMLSVNAISKSYGMETILKDISFNLSPGERLGLVGPNGSGKTTLLRILTGEEAPEAGSYHFSPPGLRLGYLPQGLAPAPDETLGGFLARLREDPEALTHRLEQLSVELARNSNQPALQQAYDATLASLEAASESAGLAPGILAALGLSDFPPETPAAHLSGGQKTRLAMAGVLLSAPQLLLLDEPTNHLDIDMLEWLEDWLAHSPASRKMAALVVSHDRAFLDNTVTGILELDPGTHSLRAYPGNYSAYLEQKLAEQEQQRRQYSDQQEEIARLQAAARAVRDAARFKRGGKGDSGDKFAKGFFANRTKETVARAKHIEKRLEQLLTVDRIDKPRQPWQMKLEFGDVPPSGRDVVSFSDLAIGYDGQALLTGLEGQIRYGERLALVGPNGAGKTTLLRTIAGKLAPIRGSLRIGASVRIGYMSQEQETLDPDLDSLETVRRLAPLSETDARAFLHKYLFAGDDVFTPIGRLSYGERARLMLACLVASGCNLLLLDEPVNHLDIPSRARFEQALETFEGSVVAVVHDRYFIQGFATHIWEIRQARLAVLL